MRVRVDTLVPGPRVLGGDAFHHVARVLRARAGDKVTLFDGRGREAEALVVRVWADELVVEVEAVRAAVRAGVALTLAVALLKGDKMDWVVQKATELGVTRIMPLAAAHAVVQLDAERQASRRQRWDKIASEAARQCGRADVPEITEVLDVATALERRAGFGVAFHEGERGKTLREVLPDEPPKEVTALVGPEGGFAPDEIAAARAAGLAVCGLGPRILRAETAAIAAACLLGYVLGDVG